MKNYAKTISALVMLFLLPFVAYKNSFAQREIRTSRVVSLPEGTILIKDYFIKAGEVVEISGEVVGDVIVFGGEVLVDGTVQGDLIAFGENVEVKGEITQDARIVGRDVNIDGTIGRNVSITAGSVRVGPEANVSGALLVAGGDVQVAGRIPGDVLIAAGNALIAGEVGGDVEGYFGNLILVPRAQIGGNVTYTSREDAQIAKDASISGQIFRKSLPAYMQPEIDSLKTRKFLKSLWFSYKFVSFLAALMVGILFIRFLPNYTKLIDKTLSKRFWSAIGVGILALFVIPIFAVILMITIVGIPLGIFILVFFLIKIYLSKIFVSLFIGSRVFPKINKYLAFSLSLFVYYIINLIPLVGSLLSFIVLILGLGVSLIELKYWYEKASEVNLI